jgi:hypothetical protein
MHALARAEGLLVATDAVLCRAIHEAFRVQIGIRLEVRAGPRARCPAKS